jgi:hypothetical protein
VPRKRVRIIEERDDVLLETIVEALAQSNRSVEEATP